MSIKKRLWLLLALSATSVVVLIVLFSYSHLAIVKLKTDVILYGSIMDDVHELTLLNNNILLHHGEKRTLRQWREKLTSIDKKLSYLDIRAEDKKKFETIKNEYIKMFILFDNLHESYQHPKSASLEPYQKRLIGQTQIHLYTIVRGIQQIIKQQRLQRLEQEQCRDTLLFEGMIGFSLMIAGLIWYLIMNMLRPLEQLQKGVSQITNGDFNTTIDLKSSDELGDFSRALDNMTHNFITAIKQLNDEVEQRKVHEGVLKEMNTHLRELDRLKTLFIASMSHELRTPLNAIIGFSGVLKMEIAGALNTKQKEQLERIHRAGEHLYTMIVDILDISKLESGDLPFIPDTFSLKMLLEELMENVQPKIANKKMQICLVIDEDIDLYTDRHRLKQSIGNYLSNAIKFSEKGTITIKAQQTKGWLEIEVTDEGIGIDNQNFNKLFQPFERLESSLKVLAGGAGLGLYLTKKIVTELMGGEVYVKSHLGEGSTFGLRIPIESKCTFKGEKNG